MFLPRPADCRRYQAWADPCPPSGLEESASVAGAAAPAIAVEAALVPAVTLVRAALPPGSKIVLGGTAVPPPRHSHCRGLGDSTPFPVAVAVAIAAGWLAPTLA